MEGNSFHTIFPNYIHLLGFHFLVFVTTKYYHSKLNYNYVSLELLYEFVDITLCCLTVDLTILSYSGLS